MTSLPQVSDIAKGNARRKFNGTRVVVAFAVLLAFTVLLQWMGRAYQSEFGAFPDEPAHFITGLMIRDYVASGCPSSPIEYAEDYYLHYPKVAFGMWGPLLHFTEAAWMLILPPSRPAIILLMAVITALTATLLFVILRAEYGSVLALGAALVFLAIPTVQVYTGMVMADGLVALLDFSAAVLFGMYLNSRAWRHALWFGIFACLSILTKGNGMALLLLPPIAILLTRQFALLKAPALWMAGAIVAGIAGPWQFFSSQMLSGILERQPGWMFTPYYTQAVFTIAGVVFIPFMLIGLYDRLIAPMRAGTLDGKWASAAALICSVWLFHCLIPAAAPELRYLIAIIPPLLMFSFAGIHGLASRIRLAAPLRYRIWAVTALLFVLFGATAFSIPKKRHFGFDRVSERLQQPDFSSSVILVSSEADGEGMLISEMAMRERRPSHFVLRASKMLGTSNWNGMHYELLYKTPDELMKFLRSVPVEILVIDNTASRNTFAHHELLKRVVTSFPNEWQRVEVSPTPALQRAVGIDVFRLKAPGGRNAGQIQIHLPYTLGRTLKR